jgi:hypothetical protein
VADEDDDLKGLEQPEETVDTGGVAYAVLEHAVSIYDRMHQESRQTEKGRVWEGHLTRLCDELNIARGYYSYVRQCLLDMGCIEQIKRGGGAGMSKWRLIKRPDEETYAGKEPGRPNKTSSSKVRTLEQQNTDLNRRVAYLEREMGNIMDFVGYNNGSSNRTPFTPRPRTSESQQRRLGGSPALSEVPADGG